MRGQIAIRDDPARTGPDDVIIDHQDCAIELISRGDRSVALGEGVRDEGIGAGLFCWTMKSEALAAICRTIPIVVSDGAAVSPSRNQRRLARSWVN